MDKAAPPLPEGDRFADVLKFRRLVTGGGDVLYECWGEAVRAYAAQLVAAERERCAKVCESLYPDANPNDCADAIRGKA